jgi:hypothetical protein
MLAASFEIRTPRAGRPHEGPRATQLRASSAPAFAGNLTARALPIAFKQLGRFNPADATDPRRMRLDRHHFRLGVWRRHA